MDGALPERQRRAVNLRLNAEVWDLAKRAYVTTWLHPELSSMTKWIDCAARTHAARSPAERAGDAAWLPRLDPSVPSVPKVFRLRPQVVEAIDNAVAADVIVRGVKTSRSAWLTEAIRLGILNTDRAYNGLDEVGPTMQLPRYPVGRALGLW
ncbi:MAG TPA: hypothetical protein VN108_06305 [Marmoricola sp.]|nr:hypothetical protein [Marmoricola sp.]